MWIPITGSGEPKAAVSWMIAQCFVLDAIIPPPPPTPSFNRLEPNAVA